MISKARLLCLCLVAATVVAACTSAATAGATAKPAAVYSIIPTQSEVRVLMGDANWWAGPPSFAVDPLDFALRPASEKYAVGVTYMHIGTAEEILARYTVYDKSSSATSAMSAYQSAYGTSPSSPKVGDQVLYYGLAGSGGAPIVYRTFVRVGQIVLTLIWARKDMPASSQQLLNQLGKNAKAFSEGLKNIDKVRAKLQAVDPKQLPPPGLDITLLGSAVLPIEAFATMTLSAVPDPLVASLKQLGLDKFAYGDYALNNDTHMEVQTALFTFPSPAAALAYAKGLGPGTPNPDGLYGAYIKASGSPGAGQYHYVFAEGPYGVYMICKPSIEGEAASRECEDPMQTTAIAWMAALQGIG